MGSVVCEAQLAQDGNAGYIELPRLTSHDEQKSIRPPTMSGYLLTEGYSFGE